jgi:hypothetical protein
LILTETQIDQIGTILRESIMAVQNQLG